MERRIREVAQETIDVFYRKMAEEFQMPVEEGYGFDSRKIRIASNIQKQWCEKFDMKIELLEPHNQRAYL